MSHVVAPKYHSGAPWIGIYGACHSCSAVIKSAVAFYMADFSRSSRLIRASSSWVVSCSGFRALLVGRISPVSLP